MQEIQEYLLSKRWTRPQDSGCRKCVSVHLSLSSSHCKLYEPDVILGNEWLFYLEAEPALFALQLGTGKDSRVKKKEILEHK